MTEKNANPFMDQIDEDNSEETQVTQEETPEESSADTKPETVEETATADTESTDTAAETAEAQRQSAFEQLGLNRTYRDSDSALRAIPEQNKTIEELRRRERYLQQQVEQFQRQQQQAHESQDFPSEDEMMENPAKYIKQLYQYAGQLHNQNNKLVQYLQAQPWNTAIEEQQTLSRFQQEFPRYKEFSNEIEHLVNNDPRLINLPLPEARELAYRRLAAANPNGGQPSSPAAPAVDPRKRNSASTASGGGRTPVDGSTETRWNGKTIEQMTQQDWWSLPDNHPFWERIGPQ